MAMMSAHPTKATSTKIWSAAMEPPCGVVPREDTPTRRRARVSKTVVKQWGSTIRLDYACPHVPHPVDAVDRGRFACRRRGARYRRGKLVWSSRSHDLASQGRFQIGRRCPGTSVRCRSKTSTRRSTVDRGKCDVEGSLAFMSSPTEDGRPSHGGTRARTSTGALSGPRRSPDPLRQERGMPCRSVTSSSLSGGPVQHGGGAVRLSHAAAERFASALARTAPPPPNVDRRR